MRRILALLTVLALLIVVAACGGDDSGEDEADQASSNSPSDDEDDAGDDDIIQDQRDGEVERESGVSLSPGDLDETLTTFLDLTGEAMSAGDLTFEAIADIRLGFFGGIEDCRLG